MLAGLQRPASPVCGPAPDRRRAPSRRWGSIPPRAFPCARRTSRAPGTNCAAVKAPANAAPSSPIHMTAFRRLPKPLDRGDPAAVPWDWVAYCRTSTSCAFHGSRCWDCAHWRLLRGHRWRRFGLEAAHGHGGGDALRPNAEGSSGPAARAAHRNHEGVFQPLRGFNRAECAPRVEAQRAKQPGLEAFRARTASPAALADCRCARFRAADDPRTAPAMIMPICVTSARRSSRDAPADAGTATRSSFQ